MNIKQIVDKQDVTEQFNPWFPGSSSIFVWDTPTAECTVISLFPGKSYVARLQTHQ